MDALPKPVLIEIVAYAPTAFYHCTHCEVVWKETGFSEGLHEEQVQSALSVLTERERQVLEMRFGLRDGKDYTLEEVGRYFNVTRERIRQIEAKALRKLRHPTRSRHLRDYLA